MKNKIILSLVILAVGLVSLLYWLETPPGVSVISEDSVISLSDTSLPVASFSDQHQTESRQSAETARQADPNTVREAGQETADNYESSSNGELVDKEEVADKQEVTDSQNELPPLQDWSGDDFDRYLAQFHQAAIDSELAFNNTQKYQALVVQKAAELENRFDLEEIACSEKTCISVLNWFGEDLKKVQSSFFASSEFNSGDITFMHYTRKATGDDSRVVLVFNSR